MTGYGWGRGGPGAARRPGLDSEPIERVETCPVEPFGGCRGEKVRLLGTGKLEGSSYSLGQGLHLVLLPPQEPVAFC